MGHQQDEDWLSQVRDRADTLRSLLIGKDSSYIKRSRSLQQTLCRSTEKRERVQCCSPHIAQQKDVKTS